MPRSKMKHPGADFHDRDPRIPLYLPVKTDPSLGECWSLNVSAGGMALTATLAEGETPAEGGVLTVDLELPDSGHRLRAAARVVWVGERARGAAGAHRVVVGLAFADLRATDRAALQRYLADYRPHVLAVNASSLERDVCAEALEPGVRLHFCDQPEELERQLARGDVYAVVVFGEEEASALAAVERVVGERTDRVPPWSENAAILPVPRVVWCARASADHLVRLHNEGRLYQSIPRPVDSHLLEIAVQRACEDFAVHSELRRVHLELRRSYLGGPRPAARAEGVPALPQLVLHSGPMKAVLDLVRVVAPHKAHVLLQGETGTGKELLARAIHQLSARADGPFLAMDCGALTETLLESELFGHVEGAFTGAHADRPGLFQMAEGGTLFLDEIENTTPALQAKLLRVLDTGEVRPVGGSKVRRVDVRLVAASNRELKDEAAAGRFRSDLYYRLAAFPIDVPPLRERRDDVLPLVRHFVEAFSKQMNRPAGALTRGAEQALERYDWPGNVRELRNCVERAVLLCGPGQRVGVELLPKSIAAELPRGGREAGSLKGRVRDFERELIRQALERNDGVIRRAAQHLRTNAVTLARKVRQHGL